MIVLQPMAVYEFISLLISIAGFITVVISIHFLNQSLQSSNQSLQSSAYEASRDQMLAMDQLFISHYELRPYFYSGKELYKYDKNYEKVRAMAEYCLDFIGSTMIQNDRFPKLWPENWWESFALYVALLFRIMNVTRIYDVSMWYNGGGNNHGHKPTIFTYDGRRVLRT